MQDCSLHICGYLCTRHQQPALTFLSLEGLGKVKHVVYKQCRTARTGCGPVNKPDLRPRLGYTPETLPISRGFKFWCEQFS